ncbi:hypothetical protein V3F56_13470 [Moorellaceae bacterium AZ2]
MAGLFWKTGEALGGLRTTKCDLWYWAGREGGFPPMWVIRELFGSLRVAVEEAGLDGLQSSK